MIMSGMLERSATAVDGYRFTVKGGVALELRLGDRARATCDRNNVAGGSGDSVVREELTHAKRGGQPSHKF